MFQKRKLDVLCCIRHSNDDPVSELNDRIYNLFLNAYKYLWLINVPRFLIIIGFVGWFSFSLCLISRIDIGLNPEITVSKDSYLIKYFRVINLFLISRIKFRYILFAYLTKEIAKETLVSVVTVCRIPVTEIPAIFVLEHHREGY